MLSFTGPAAPTTGLFSNAAFTGVSFASLSADGDAGFRKSGKCRILYLGSRWGGVVLQFLKIVVPGGQN